MHRSSATHERIVAATTRLLDEGGRDAVSTRAVGAAAGVQAPTIYRLFGDKQGLLDAVVLHGFTAYLEDKAVRSVTDDPVGDLRTGWDAHVAFGLEHPAVYGLMYSERGDLSPAAAAAFGALHALMGRIAAAGRLRVPVEQAAQLVHAAGYGVTTVLIATPAASRDPALSGLAREGVIAAVTTDRPVAAAPGPVAAAVALRARLDETDVLSAGERELLGEWLDRVARR